MNEPSTTYYFLSTLAGLALGIFVSVAEYKVWSKYFSSGDIIFKYEKYNFECMADCAVLAHIGFVLFGLCCLFIGIHALIKLFR
tara:strand:+ start:1461 stop:1712 length:252 start_codon:yes stop_codon:yes gene_type:complete